MTEIIFDCYQAPSLAYGIDSLFSFRHNKGKTGLIVSSSNAATHLIPVYNSKALLGQSTRLAWGGYHAATFLQKFMHLKYPGFPGKVNLSQFEYMLQDHCYISKEYDDELRTYLDWTGLEDRDIVVQYPFTEEVIIQKSEEELARIAERKKESGRRLQEQAAKMRLEKLVKKEQELEYYKQVQQRLVDQTKKEIRRVLDAEELKDENALDKTVRELEKAIKKARNKDVGGDAEEDQEPPVYDLLEVPDDQLDDAGIKQKRQQRLNKASHEARARAKAEKEAEKARIVEEQRLDDEKREKNLEGWLEQRRAARALTLQKMKERDRLTKDLGNRKSMASQNRMKSIANLASDNPTKKRRRGGDDDDFGANDDDWAVYRQIAVGDNSDDEQEEDLMEKLRAQEQELLKFDADFTYENTWEAQSDWSKSLLHAFTRGPRPFNPSSQAQLAQIHLNTERIRMPECVFQPSIAGVDQAGVVEIAGDILNQRLAGAPYRDDLLRDVFLTGGYTLFRNFDERVRAGLRMLLPDDAPLAIRRAGDPLLDAWKGAAGWAGSTARKSAAVTREEYQEKGPDYIKASQTLSSPSITHFCLPDLPQEHDMGNAFA
jgi:actin-related protein 5